MTAQLPAQIPMAILLPSSDERATRDLIEQACEEAAAEIRAQTFLAQIEHDRMVLCEI